MTYIFDMASGTQDEDTLLAEPSASTPVGAPAAQYEPHVQLRLAEYEPSQTAADTAFPAGLDIDSLIDSLTD